MGVGGGSGWVGWIEVFVKIQKKMFFFFLFFFWGGGSGRGGGQWERSGWGGWSGWM